MDLLGFRDLVGVVGVSPKGASIQDPPADGVVVATHPSQL